METVRRKKLKEVQLQKLSSTINGVDALDNFYTDRPFAD